jgi:hypothetical protein
MRDRPDYRSYSQLETFMLCGEQFRLTRRVGIPERPSVWLPGGSAFHTATEAIDNGTLHNESIEDTWEWAHEHHINEQVERLREQGAPPEWLDPANWRCANKGTETIEWWRKSGLRFCEDYARWREQSDLTIIELNGSLVMETELMPILHGIPVKMYPDRLMVDGNGQLLIVDMKTGSKDVKLGLQLGVYKVGIEKLLGLDVEWGAYYMARKGTTLPPLPLGHWTEDTVGSVFRTFDEQERAGQYLPRLGDHCNWKCAVKEWCVYQGGKRHEDDVDE